MKRFITIYIDEETGEIIDINKYNRKDFNIKLLEKKWRYERNIQTLTCIYKAKKRMQLLAFTHLEKHKKTSTYDYRSYQVKLHIGTKKSSVLPNFEQNLNNDTNWTI